MFFSDSIFSYLIFNVIAYGCLAGIVNTIFKRIQDKTTKVVVFTILKIFLYIILSCMFITEFFIETSIGENMFFVWGIVLIIVSIVTCFFIKNTDDFLCKYLRPVSIDMLLLLFLTTMKNCD